MIFATILLCVLTCCTLSKSAAVLETRYIMINDIQAQSDELADSDIENHKISAQNKNFDVKNEASEIKSVTNLEFEHPKHKHSKSTPRRHSKPTPPTHSHSRSTHSHSKSTPNHSRSTMHIHDHSKSTRHIHDHSRSTRHIHDHSRSTQHKHDHSRSTRPIDHQSTTEVATFPPIETELTQKPDILVSYSVSSAPEEVSELVSTTAIQEETTEFKLESTTAALEETTESELESTTDTLEVITESEHVSTTNFEEVSTTELILETTTPPHDKCDEDDIDCIVDNAGKITNWFKCPEDMGSYRHPKSNKLFIFCINWKPSIKRCGQDLQFSEKLQTCTAP